VRYSSHQAEESYEAFNARYETFFTQVGDLFELQRGLNNAFAYDLVPSTQVVEAALRASRKVNDYATAVRILEGVKEKVENKGQYKEYLKELEPVLAELGECLLANLLQRGMAHGLLDMLGDEICAKGCTRSAKRTPNTPIVHSPLSMSTPSPNTIHSTTVR
jgi:cytochrome c oxidase subunit 5a